MKTQCTNLDFKGQNIYVGLDVHLKNWKVTIMTDELTHKAFSQTPKPEILYNYLLNNFPGANYHSAYEAGFCGFWIHNKLKLLGVNSIVVNPADIPTTDKEKKHVLFSTIFPSLLSDNLRYVSVMSCIIAIIIYYEYLLNLTL